jgi:N-acetylmuramate 1-kinase
MREYTSNELIKNIPADIRDFCVQYVSATSWDCCTALLLTPGAGDREYIRIEYLDKTAIVVYGFDTKENNVFRLSAEHVHKYSKDLVPNVLFTSHNQSWYVVDDCGDIDLLSVLKQELKKDTEIQSGLYNAVDSLVLFQNATKDWDYAHSYPQSAFDSTEIIQYMNKFQHRLLANLGVVVDQRELDIVTASLCDAFNHIPKQYWGTIHRDYQARNIFVQPDTSLRIIDFQALRYGPLIYDVVSLLGQSQMRYSAEVQDSVCSYFAEKKSLDIIILKKHIPLIRLIRNIQSLGSYGVAGLENKKQYFIDAIPVTLEKALADCIVNRDNGLYIDTMIDLIERAIVMFVRKY